MGFFVIPSGFNGLGSDRTIYIDNSASLAFSPKERGMKFGEGYKQTVRLSNPKRQVSVSFSAREPEEINLIELFFIYLAGSAIPDLDIFGEWNAKVAKFNKNYMNGAVYSLTATFEEL